MLSGGYLKDIPLPHKRQWPGDENKRGVRFNIGVYSGIGRHYHVSFSQDANPIWNPQANEEAKPKWKEVQGTGMDGGSSVGSTPGMTRWAKG